MEDNNRNVSVEEKAKNDNKASADEAYKKLIIHDIPEILKEKEVPRKKSKKGLFYALGAAAFVLLLVVSVLTTVLNRVEIAGNKYEKDVSSIYLFDRKLTQEDIDSFGEFEQLSYLQLKNCTLPGTDLSWLSAVTSTVELENCGLTDAHIESVDFSTVRFTSFDVDGNTKITDLSPLAKASNKIASLSFSGCSVNDLSFVGGMKKLVSLYFDSNKVTDLSPLADCINLQVISFDSNKVSSLVPLSKCIRLTRIFANNNELGSLEGLESATDLTEIEANGNAVSDIEALKNLSALKKVFINVDKNNASYTGNGFADLSCLVNSAATINELSLDGSATTDFSHLEKFKKLELLSVNNCSGFTTLSYLEGCKMLRSLSASGCKLTSLDGIEGLNNINYLNVSDNSITTLDSLPLFKQNNVYLNASNNLISSVVLPEQSYNNLVIYGNPVKELDLSQVKGFKLAIGYSDLFDYNALAGKFSSYFLIDCPNDKHNELITVLGKSAVSFVSESEYGNRIDE